MALPIKKERLESLIMRYTSEIIRTELPNVGFVTITACVLTADISHAKIFVSFFEKEKMQDQYHYLIDNKSLIRRLLASRLTIRKVPEIEFIIDNSNDHGNKIEEIIKNSIK